MFLIGVGWVVVQMLYLSGGFCLLYVQCGVVFVEYCLIVGGQYEVIVFNCFIEVMYVVCQVVNCQNGFYCFMVCGVDLNYCFQFFVEQCGQMVVVQCGDICFYVVVVGKGYFCQCDQQIVVGVVVVGQQFMLCYQGLYCILEVFQLCDIVYVSWFVVELVIDLCQCCCVQCVVFFIEVDQQQGVIFC